MDVDDVFPSLDCTLQTMNAAQPLFGFELVDMSLPLDVWDLESNPGTPYLRAEQLAHRLRNKTVELQVNVLACITRHWLRDDEWLNIHGWWPNGGKPPVLIFSIAGLDELGSEGSETIARSRTQWSPDWRAFTGTWERTSAGRGIARCGSTSPGPSTRSSAPRSSTPCANENWVRRSDASFGPSRNY